MRYVLDETDLEPEASLAAYRAALAWAAPSADRFALLIEPEVYDDPGDLARLYALGQAAPPADPRLHDTVQVTGKPGAAFIPELTSKGSPAKAISGDLCPVQQVTLFAGELRLYACYDYGRTQILDLTPEQAEDLRATLRQSGLDPAILTLAPPYMTDKHL